MCAEVLLSYTEHIRPDLENHARFYVDSAE